MITLVNWHTYQPQLNECGQPVGNRRATGGQPAGTIKDINNNIHTLTTFECVSDSGARSDPHPQKKQDEKNASFDLDSPDTETKTGEVSCPHRQIIETYHEMLPELPRVRIWRSQQAAQLRTRWREKFKEGKFTDEASGIAYFRRFFGYVSKSDFLMGRRTNRDGRAFRNTLAWMMQAKHFDDIISGKYHDREEV